MKNIFLTGDSDVGKTTIINQVLRETGIAAKGFRTVRVLKNQGEKDGGTAGVRGN